MIKSHLKQEFPCSVEELWNIITDNNNYIWRSDLSRIVIIDDLHFIEYTKKGFPTNFTITTKRPYEEYRFSLQNANIKGEWIGLFKQLSNGNTELDFTEKILTNSLIMKLPMKLYLKKQQKCYLRDLAKHIDELSTLI